MEKFNHPKVLILFGALYIVVGILMLIYTDDGDKFMAGIMFGIGLGTVLSNVYRLSGKENKE